VPNPVIQEEATGCGIASVANILGKTYSEMKDIAGAYCSNCQGAGVFRTSCSIRLEPLISRSQNWDLHKNQDAPKEPPKPSIKAMKLLLVGCLSFILACSPHDPNAETVSITTIELPEPQRSGEVSVEEALQQRRSIRDYASTPLTLAEIGQLAWSAQGITDSARGLRAAPSAGATFPVEIYSLISDIDDLADGVYRYRNDDHSLEQVIEGDLRPRLFRVSLGQDAIMNAPVVMVITGVLRRIEPRYRERAMRFMYMEAGHVAQNVYLQSVPLEIGTVVIGAFRDDGVSEVLQLDDGEYPLYIMPIGKLQ